MVQEIDETFHAACFVGWHSSCYSDAVPLAHTMSSIKLMDVRVNGVHASEFLLHAYTAALVGVPVMFVSGDEGLCAEVKDFDDRIVTCPVMRGVGPSTVSLHPEASREHIRAGVEEALQNKPWKPSLPESFEVEITYKTATDAYQKSFYPGARQISGSSIGFETNDWFEVMRLLRFVIK